MGPISAIRALDDLLQDWVDAAVIWLMRRGIRKSTQVWAVNLLIISCSLYAVCTEKYLAVRFAMAGVAIPLVALAVVRLRRDEALEAAGINPGRLPGAVKLMTVWIGIVGLVAGSPWAADLQNVFLVLLQYVGGSPGSPPPEPKKMPDAQAVAVGA